MQTNCMRIEKRTTVKTSNYAFRIPCDFAALSHSVLYAPPSSGQQGWNRAINPEFYESWKTTRVLGHPETTVFCETTNSDDTGRCPIIQGSQVMHGGSIQCFERGWNRTTQCAFKWMCLCSIPYLTALSLSDRKPLWNSRVVTQTDDVHLCIMCLRAIMNYQVWQRDNT